MVFYEVPAVHGPDGSVEPAVPEELPEGAASVGRYDPKSDTFLLKTNYEFTKRELASLRAQQDRDRLIDAVVAGKRPDEPLVAEKRGDFSVRVEGVRAYRDNGVEVSCAVLRVQEQTRFDETSKEQRTEMVDVPVHIPQPIYIINPPTRVKVQDAQFVEDKDGNLVEISPAVFEENPREALIQVILSLVKED